MIAAVLLVAIAGCGGAGSPSAKLAPSSPSTDGGRPVVATPDRKRGRRVLHLVYRVLVASSDDNTRRPPITRTEQWSAANPPRWRLEQTVPAPETARQASEPYVAFRGEFAYAHGVQVAYNPTRRRLSVTRGFSDRGPAARVPGPLGSAPTLVRLRAELARGALLDLGPARYHGQLVRRLRSAPRRASKVQRLITYLVDPHTFKPKALSMKFSNQGRRVGGVVKVQIIRIDRLPLNARTLRLLAFDAPPTTTVILRDRPAGTPRLLRGRPPCGPGMGPVRCVPLS